MTFQETLLEKLEAYESSLDPEAMMDAADAVMECIMGRLHLDGIDGIWYARMNDRVNTAAFYGSCRYADDATFHGLVHLIGMWSKNLTPQTVHVDD